MLKIRITLLLTHLLLYILLQLLLILLFLGLRGEVQLSKVSDILYIQRLSVYFIWNSLVFNVNHNNSSFFLLVITYCRLNLLQRSFSICFNSFLALCSMEGGLESQVTDFILLPLLYSLILPICKFLVSLNNILGYNIVLILGSLWNETVFI